jgi:type III pantothenate kinase
MLLAVDIGNSHTVIGIFYNQALFHQWRLKTDRQTTADELILACHTLFALDELCKEDITGFIVCSVVPVLEPVWLKFAERYFINLLSPPLAVSHQLDTGLRIQTPNPAELGADRLVNAVAAWESLATALIVIDIGTAITFDCVSDKGEYLGGTIHPGLKISLEALSERTAKLPCICFNLHEKPAAVIGTSTTEAIRSGMLHGFGGLISRMTELLGQEMREQGATDGKISVIATGGMAEQLLPYSPAVEFVDPALTMTGLRILHERVCQETN